MIRIRDVRRAAAAALMLILCAAVAACGGSSSSTSNAGGGPAAATTTTPSATLSATSPSTPPATTATSTAPAKTQGTTASGSTPPSSPSGTSPSRRTVAPKVARTLASFAACMRANKIDLAPPNTSGHGPLFDLKGLDTKSPQFRAALRRCASAFSGIIKIHPGLGKLPAPKVGLPVTPAP